MTDEPRPPTQEPEIIPPDRSDPRGPRARRAPRPGEPDFRVFADFPGTTRIRVVKLGPIGATLIGLLIAALVVLTLLLLAGVFLIWIPLVAIVVAIAVISGLLRSRFGRRT